MKNGKLGIGSWIAIIGLAISISSCIAMWIMIPGISEFIFPGDRTKSGENDRSQTNQGQTNPENPLVETEILFEPTPAEPDPNNLVYNGYFLNDFDGWQRELVDEGGGSKASITSFGSSLFNRALHIEHEGLGQIYFYQDVDTPSLDLVFSCSFNANSTEGPIMGFSGTGYSIIGLLYLDSQGETLGLSRIINFNENLFAGTGFVGVPEKMSDTNTTHNIEVESKNTYANFTLDIMRELTNNLLGIDPGQVDSISIVLLVGSNDKSASAELTIADIVLKEK